ncbi:hypothetical protein J2128_001354 [Methanomicrobium sp. W14]|nr:hypothetical protein [Methanomicrobium sp. W14]
MILIDLSLLFLPPYLIIEKFRTLNVFVSYFRTAQARRLRELFKFYMGFSLCPKLWKLKVLMCPGSRTKAGRKILWSEADSVELNRHRITGMHEKLRSFVSVMSLINTHCFYNFDKLVFFINPIKNVWPLIYRGGKFLDLTPSEIFYCIFYLIS